MTDINKLPFERAEEIKALAAQYGVDNIRVFGSVARGEATPDSDIDLLVRLNKPMGYKFVGLEREMSEMLGVEVQLISDKGVNHLIKERVFNEARPL